jgi:hypothetical protein
VPLGDGTWAPSLGSWAEGTGPEALLTNTETVYSHATFMVRDGLLGPLYLVFQEVFEPDEQAADFLLSVTSDLLTQRNTGFSQPFYYRLDWVQLMQGKTRGFLKTYYNGLASLADRDTYTFHEHYFYVQPHKVHEEAWFLMQTRWMLWMERAETGGLDLLPGIPRAWMEDGKAIELEKVASYFGPLQVQVSSHVVEGYIQATIQVDQGQAEASTAPRTIRVRLPHPEGKKAIAVVDQATQKPFAAGVATYDAETESVTLKGVAKASMQLMFE